MIDHFLVRHGHLVGLLAPALFAVLVVWVTRARTGARHRSALRAFGTPVTPDPRRIGQIVVMDGRLRAQGSTKRHAGPGTCAASSVRVEGRDEDASLATRHATLELAADVMLRLEGPCEVRFGRDQRVVGAEDARALGLTVEAHDAWIDHALHEGDRVRVRARLEQADGAYRERALRLVASADEPIVLASLEPSRQMLRRRSVVVGLVTFVATSALVQVAALGASQAPRGLPLDGSALPRPLGHRLALLSIDRTASLDELDELLASARTSEDLVLLTADAHRARGGCGRAIEIVARRGLVDSARDRAGRCRTIEASRAMVSIDRSEGDLTAALGRLEPIHAQHLERLRDELGRGDRSWLGFAPRLAVEAGRFDLATQWLDDEIALRPRGAEGLRCVAEAIADRAATARADSPACTLLSQLPLEAPDVTDAPTEAELRFSRELGFTTEILLLEGSTARWDAVTQRSLAQLRAGANEGPDRCRLETARIVHAVMLDAHAPSDPTLHALHCPAESLDAYIALRAATGPLPPASGLLAAALVFRAEPSATSLATLERYRVLTAYLHSDEIGGTTPAVITRASRGDAVALERTLGARLASYVSPRPAAAIDAARLRARGGPEVTIDQLRDERYEDLRLAELSHDEHAATRAREAITRLERSLDSRERVILAAAISAAR